MSEAFELCVGHFHNVMDMLLVDIISLNMDKEKLPLGDRTVDFPL